MHRTPTAVLATGLMLLGFGFTGFAQTTMNFPLAIEPEIGTSVGFAFANPGPVPATIILKAYCTSGQDGPPSPTTCVEGAENGTATAIVPAGGQFSRLYSQFFSSNQRESWVQVTSTTSQLKGFVVAGDFVNAFDGLESAAASSDQILPFASDFLSIGVANPGDSPIQATLRFYDASGTELLPALTWPVAPRGIHEEDVIDIAAGNTTYATARYVRVTASAAFSTVAAVARFLQELRTETGDFVMINGVDVVQLTNQLNFPHIVSGPLNPLRYTTVIGVTNGAATPQTITLTFHPVNGPAITAQRNLAARGALKETMEDLFGAFLGSQPALRDGWLHVQGVGPLTGFTAYVETSMGGAAAVAPQRASATNLLFPHIADLPPWSTGIALLNTGAVQATVEVFALTPEGTLIGGATNVPTARFTVAGNTKVAKELFQLIPQTRQRTGDGGFIFIRSDVPLFGIELFYLRSGKAFGNVPASPLSPGLFTLPNF